jgi:uncharacterized membrane protein
MNTYFYIFYSFVIYSAIGWGLEVLYHLYLDKKFVNRGFLFGPVCPIYGSTAVILILILTPFRGNMFYVFIGGSVAASFIELITGYLLELFFHTKWWDYSEERWNFRGYICLKFSVIWGLLSLVFIQAINPNISRLTYWIIGLTGEFMYNLILILLIIDIVLTINHLIAFRKLFIEIQDIIVETKHHMDKLMEKTLSKESIINIQQRIKFLGELNERLSKKVSLRQKNMLHSYPRLTSKKFGGAIEEIKKRMGKMKK